MKRLCAAGIAFSLVAATAWAHGGATGVVKERMDAMLGMASALERLTGLVEQTRPDAQAIGEVATVLEQHAGDRLTSLFPEGSLDAPSQAVPAIWSDWPEFAGLAAELKRLARSLPDAATTEAASEPLLIQPVEAIVGDPRAIWDRLDERYLLGLESEAGGSASPAGAADAGPTLAAVYRGIASNCASCHRQFRRQKR